MRGRPIASMVRTPSPCFDCKDRNESCRPKCAKWKEYEKAHREEKDKIYKNKREYYLGFGAPYRTEKEWNRLMKKDSQNEARVFKQKMK